MKTLITALTVLIAAGPIRSEVSSPAESETDSSFVELIYGLLRIEDRSWAKPIERIDTGEVLEKIDTGILSYHKADWFVKVNGDE